MGGYCPGALIVAFAYDVMIAAASQYYCWLMMDVSTGANMCDGGSIVYVGGRGRVSRRRTFPPPMHDPLPNNTIGGEEDVEGRKGHPMSR